MQKLKLTLKQFSEIKTMIKADVVTVIRATVCFLMTVTPTPAHSS